MMFSWIGSIRVRMERDMKWHNNETVTHNNTYIYMYISQHVFIQHFQLHPWSQPPGWYEGHLTENVSFINLFV